MKSLAATRKCVIFLFGLGIIVCLACIIFHPFEPRHQEPQYQDKKLTEWAREIDQADFLRPPAFQLHQKQNEAAIAAIRQIGTNALPMALELCGAKDSWLKRKFEGWADQYNDGVWTDRRHFPIQIKSAGEKHYEGVNIILALGPAAAPAIPALMRLLQSRDKEVVEAAMSALPGIGTNAIPSLLELLNNTNPDIRLRAAVALGDYFGAQAHAAVPILLQCLDNRGQNLVMRVHAVHSLSMIKGDAPTIVPAIIRHVQSETNDLMLSNYLMALGNFGMNANAAVPALVHILELNPDQPHSRIKEGVLENLLKIDPETAKPFLNQWKGSLTN
jgi:hypothetical protein